MSDVEIRVDAIDADHVVLLLRELSRDLNLRYGVDPDAVDEYVHEIPPSLTSPPHGVFLTAWNDAVLIGCGALRPGSQPGTVEVKRMYVRPDARGRGISRLVLRELEAHAAMLGYERLELETGTMQPEAMHVYETAGWRPIDGYGKWADVEFTRYYGKEVRRDGDAG